MTLYLILSLIFAPLIFDQTFAEESNNNTLMPEQEQTVEVVKVTRHGDWQKGEHYFEITLNNHQSFHVQGSIEDLVSEKFYVGLALLLEKEEFIEDEPGYSTFFYGNAEEGIQLQGKAASINSHWIPNLERHPIVE